MNIEKEIRELKAHAKVLDGWVRDRSNELKQAALTLKDNTDRRLANVEEIINAATDRNSSTISAARVDILSRCERGLKHVARRVDNLNRALTVLTKRIEELEHNQ